MKGESESRGSLPNGNCLSGSVKVTTEKKSSAHKWQCLLYGALNGVLLIILIFMISTFCLGGNQTGCAEQGETPISENTLGGEPPGESSCVRCTILPSSLWDSLGDESGTRCCTNDDFSFKDLVNAFVDKTIASRLPDEAQKAQKAPEPQKPVPDFHTNMIYGKGTGEILDWKKTTDGSPNNTHLRIEKSGFYFVSTDVSFNFTTPCRQSVRNAAFSIKRWENATENTSSLFFIQFVPNCARDYPKTRNCIVPNEVGGIKSLEEGDMLFVETNCPEGVYRNSTSFGFQMISPSSVVKKMQ